MPRSGRASIRSSGVEGREFRLRHRVVVSVFVFGMLVAFLVTSLRLPPPQPSLLLPMVGLLALMDVPFVAYVLTSRVGIQNGVLTRRSVFGTQRLALAEVRRADLRFVSTKGGRQERMTLTGPVTVRLGEQREEWPTLRDAILAELPSGVRPDRPA